MCSVYCLKDKFNIDFSCSELRRLYWIKFINEYKQREKESGRVHERDFGNSKSIRQILVVYLWYNIFIYASNFGFTEFYWGRLKLVSIFFFFFFFFWYQSKTFKNYQKCFLFYQKRFQLLYFTLPLFFLFLAITGFVEVDWW